MKFTASRLLLTAMFGAVAGMPQLPPEFTSIGPPPAMAADPAGTKAILKIVRGRKELEPADVIREVNQRPVNNVSDFERATRQERRGERILLLVQRGDNAVFFAWKRNKG